MTHEQALEAAILAAGFDPRNPAVREAWQAGIAKYLAAMNEEAEFWTCRNNLENLWMTGIGVVSFEGEDVWDAAKQCWGSADVPLFAAPVSAGGEKVKVKPLEWDGRNSDGTILIANVVPMQYWAWELAGYGYWSWGTLAGREVHGGIEAAKAAAQADYEQRILSALASLPTDDRKEKGE